MTTNIRAAIVGAGYIATWHADALRATAGVTLTAVCDTSAIAANDFAEGYGIKSFTSVEELIAANVCDAVHILTPPQLHADLAVQCLNAGLHVLVEKPVALSTAEMDRMNQAAKDSGKILAAGHNFLGIPAYERLKSAVQSGRLGRISGAEINWCFPLTPLRSGPYGLWMLREPKNLLMELGPHLYAFAVDLFGKPEIEFLSLGKPIELPAAGTRHQSMRVLARAGDVDITFNLSTVESFDDRTVTVRGSSGLARLSYALDVLTISNENASDLIINPFRRQIGDAWESLREGMVNVTRQTMSLNRKSPYALSFQGAFKAFYHAIATNTPLDARFNGDSALRVIQSLEATAAMMPNGGRLDAVHAAAKTAPKPTVLVIGGTGFIGRDLTRALVASGRDVRVLSRGRYGPFADIADHVETVGVSLKDFDGLRRAMEGIDTVYNLAKSLDKTWDGCLENDVGVSNRIAEAALAAGVRRFIYTGTIASYDMSDPSVTITEDTPFGADMTDRNLYARSKAECERQLLAMHRDRGLPLVIARPGIVVGKGGPLQHWGIGRWHGAGAVRIWGNGRNTLPFVLSEDICDALIRMIDAGDEILGESFNLTGTPMMSAHDYFDAIHSALGARIIVKSGNLTAFYLIDGVKSVIKQKILRRHGVIRPSLRDWKSRAHFSPFDNTKTKSMLGWSPEENRDTFIQKAIVEANLIGF